MAKIHSELFECRYDSTSSNEEEGDYRQEQTMAMEMNHGNPEEKPKPKGIYYISEPFRVRWDIFVILLAIYNCFSIPYQVSFESDSDYSLFLNIMDILIDLVFIIDIVLNFQTTYIDLKTGEEVTEKNRIAKNYLWNGRFFIDIIASIPFDVATFLFDLSESISLIKLLKLIRVLRLSKIIYYLRIRETVKISIRIGKVLLFILIYIHFIACGWNLIVYLDESWEKNLNYYESSNWKKYTFSLYTGISTLVGIEISPSNNLEYVFCMSLILSGALMITYVLGEIAVLIYNLNRDLRDFNKTMDEVNTVMKNLRISESIQLKIIQYITSNNVYIIHNKDWLRFQEVVSKSFIEEIKLHQYYSIFSSHKIFGRYPSMIKKFILNFEYNFIRPGQNLIRTGDESKFFYFVVKGSLEVQVEGFDEIDYTVRRLNSGDYCGEIGLLYGVRRTADVTATDYCTIGELSDTIFFSLLKENSELGEMLKKRMAETYNDPWRETMKVNHIERILRKLCYLHLINAVTLDKIIYSLEKVFFYENTVVFEEKAVPEEIYIVILGKVTVYTSIYDSRVEEYLRMERIRVRTDLLLRSDRTLRRNKVRRETMADINNDTLSGLPLISLSFGSILCGILAILKEKLNIYCTTDRPTTIFVLNTETLNKIAAEDLRLRIGIESVVNKYSHFDRIYGQSVIIPPIIDCHKAFSKKKHVYEVIREKAVKRMKNVALMVLREHRIRKIRKVYSYKALVLKLKAVKEAEKNGLFQLAKDVANGEIHYEAVELERYVSLAEMKIPLLMEFAKLAKNFRIAMEKMGMVAGEIEEEFRGVELYRERNLRVMEEI